MRQARYRFIVVLILLLFAGLALRAQQNSEIVGTVTDQTGAAVPGASLTLTQKETGFRLQHQFPTPRADTYLPG